MSSTNRGYVRHKSDYYVTPISAIVHFLAEWAKDEPDLKNVRQILDPCAGGLVKEDIFGRKLVTPTSYPSAINSMECWPMFHADADMQTMDIREDSPAQKQGDYLQSSDFAIPDLIITNPPFSLALEITTKALNDVAPSGFVVMLQRLNWLGSEKRREFWQANPAQRIYVHSQRMSFTEDGKQDSIEYAHFVWRRQSGITNTILRVI